MLGGRSGRLYIIATAHAGPALACHTASDSMEDHRSSEAVGGAGFDVGELGTVGGGDDVCGLITNVAP